MTIREARLYSYTIPFDDGAAPNPFNGMCTLAICKPGIRSTAKVGDWVVGLGARTAPKDLSGRVVYAMKVTERMTMAAYDAKTRTIWTHRIPVTGSMAMQDRLGDSIYDFSSGNAVLRTGSVHNEGNRGTDLRGENVLVSTEFYYFGSNAIPLHRDLHPIIHQTQGHKSQANKDYFHRFVDWINSLGLAPGQLYGWPGSTVDWQSCGGCGGCSERQTSNQADQEWLGNEPEETRKLTGVNK